MDNKEYILDVKKLNTTFISDRKEIKIVKDVSFKVRRAKTLAVVGESGCGKSVTMNSIMRFTGKNAIVKAERDTEFKATITPEQLTELRQLIDHSINSWTSVLANHRAEQTKLITEHESNMRKMLRRNEGVWYSDFWMKVLVIFLLVYTVGVGLVVYCAT